MRYLIFSAAAVFIFFVTVVAYSHKQINSVSKHPMGTALLHYCITMVVVVFALYTGPMTGMWKSIMNDPERLKYISGRLSRDNYIKTFSAQYEPAYDFVQRRLRPHEQVLINDGIVFGLKSDFINAHSLHSDYIRYDKMDALQFSDLMNKERVHIALIRREISGITPQLLYFLQNKMTLTQKIGPYDVYELI